MALIWLAVLFVAPTPALASGRPLGTSLSAAESMAAVKLGKSNAQLSLSTAPSYTVGSEWATTDLRRWNSGFLPGSLWYEYQRSGESSWAAAARIRQSGLAGLATYSGTPDIACILLNSYARAYRLTGDEKARNVALAGAANLAGRYNANIGMLRAHGTGSDFRTIVDQMMNAELLFWAADNGGNPAWRDMAAKNAVRTASDFQRTDGSTYHYATYNTSSGALLSRGTLAGAHDESTWSRGQAWFIYGMAVAYRETGDARLLLAARRATDYWTSHVPADGIPYWDFDAPGLPDAPRDTSAAAIAASAFVELSTLDPDRDRRAEYLRIADATLAKLASPAYLSGDSAGASVLMHGTYSATKGAADHGTIWGDYFFREALMRLGSGVHRIDGRDRYESAVRASQLQFASSRVVVIAGGETYADALSASGLAGALRAPVLLTKARSVPPSILAEVVRLGATRVIVVGGRSTVSDQAVASLRRIPGATLERIDGADRYVVSAKIATRVLASPDSSGRVFVARGDAFPDALSVSPIAWATRSAVLLTRPTALSDQARTVLAGSGISTVTVVGGEGSVAPRTLREIQVQTGAVPVRLAGRDRYEVAAAVADWAVSNGLVTGARIGIATGADYPDALAGGTAIGKVGGVLLLTKRSELCSVTRNWLRSHRTVARQVTVYGGPASISEPVESRIDQIVTFGR